MKFVAKKINIQRRSSVAHILKEKQNQAIAQSNMMHRRFSIAIRDQIIEEHDSDFSDNESGPPPVSFGKNIL